MVVVFLFLMFMLVFLCSVYALKEAGFGAGRTLIALCVAGLSVIGVLDCFRGTDGVGSLGFMRTILLPYVALAFTLMVLFLIWPLYLFGFWVFSFVHLWHVERAWKRRASQTRTNSIEPKEPAKTTTFNRFEEYTHEIEN